MGGMGVVVEEKSERLASLEGVKSELLQGPVSSEDSAESVDLPFSK